MKKKILILLIITIITFPSCAKALEVTNGIQEIETPEIEIYNNNTITKIPMESTYYKNIAIYAKDNLLKNSCVETLNDVPQNITDTYSEQKGKIFLTDTDYINRLFYKENGKIHRSNLYTFLSMFSVSELWGYSWTNENTITISTQLTKEQIQETIIHELGHFIDKQTNVSINLSDMDIKKMGQLTKTYSPCNNPEHIESNQSEAFAQSLYFYIYYPEILEKTDKNIYEFWNLYCKGADKNETKIQNI